MVPEHHGQSAACVQEFAQRQPYVACMLHHTLEFARRDPVLASKGRVTMHCSRVLLREKIDDIPGDDEMHDVIHSLHLGDPADERGEALLVRRRAHLKAEIMRVVLLGGRATSEMQIRNDEKVLCSCHDVSPRPNEV